jgi:hypothetical protein
MGQQEIMRWLEAGSQLEGAEEALSEMLSNAERLAKLLQDRPSTPFDPNSWPDAKTVSAALKGRDDAQRALDEADAALTDRDRKLLKPVKPVTD